MRSVIVSMNVTLDGFMSLPDGRIDWHFPFWNEEMALCASEQLRTMDTILLGRNTYEHMARYWPSAPAGDYADMMNGHAKIVVSGSLHEPGWNNSRIMRDPGTELPRLKAMPGGDIIVYGSAALVSSLMQQGLADEYRIWVHPVVVGEGRPFFKGMPERTGLHLLRTRSFATGVVILYYRTFSK